MKVERRTFTVEVRAIEGEARKIGGHAAVFNKRSENLGGFFEVIAPGAFSACLGDDVRCLMNHDENRVLGRTRSKTLALSQDDNGLAFECSPADTTYARDLGVCMDRGDIDQCSFSFVVAPGGATWSDDDASGLPVRTITKVSRLFDVSVVTYPAYTETDAQFRSFADVLSERQTAGHEAPPASQSGGVDADLLRRKLELAYYQIQ